MLRHELRRYALADLYTVESDAAVLLSNSATVSVFCSDLTFSEVNWVGTESGVVTDNAIVSARCGPGSTWRWVRWVPQAPMLTDQPFRTVGNAMVSVWCGPESTRC